MTALQLFLGFCGDYRRFVKDYSKVTHPLSQLLSGYPPAAKQFKGKEESTDPNPSEPFGHRWDGKCEAAFEELKRRLT